MTCRRMALLGLLGLLPFRAWAAGLQDVLPGARERAMGGAFTAVGGDLAAVFYNPALLALQPSLEAGLDLSRIVSPSGPASSLLLAGAGRMPILPGGVSGMAYYALRQPGVGDKDTLAFSWGRSQAFPSLRSPVQWGASLKLVDYRTPDRNRFGLGADGGVLLDCGGGAKAGASLLDLTTGVGLPEPVLSLGASKVWGRYTLAGDLRLRPGLAAFYPGVEASYYSGLLKLRAGKGLPWDGRDSLALGLGVDLSTFTIDVQMNLPWGGLTQPLSEAGLTVVYRFGGDIFSPKPVTALPADSAAPQRADLLPMAAPPSSAPAPVESAPQPPPSWPLKHVVREGETLRSIAGEHYKDPSQWELIYNANPDKLERGLPRIGAELTIPAPRS